MTFVVQCKSIFTNISETKIIIIIIFSMKERDKKEMRLALEKC